MLVATAVSAQSPAPSGVPAKTSWQPFPASQLGGAAPTVTPPAPPAIGTRVVVFQKPAGGDQPVGKGADPLPLPGVPPAKPAGLTDPKPTDIRLLDDPMLEAELLRSYNAQQLEAYNRTMEGKKPDPKTRDEMPPSEGVKKLLTVPFPPSAPRSVLGAAPSTLYLEPGYVVHRRLMFEEKNAERYGWNLGIAQPFVSTAYFYKDLLLYPMKLASNLGERYDTSAGKAMAGSPVPYLLYPPELTFGGMAIGSMAVVGTVFLLP